MSTRWRYSRSTCEFIHETEKGELLESITIGLVWRIRANWRESWYKDAQDMVVLCDWLMKEVKEPVHE